MRVLPRGFLISVALSALGCKDAALDKRAGASLATPVTDAARARVPAVAYAAFTRERVVVAGARGRADVARAIDATEATRFEAASIAKTIVATCVMQLVEEKKLDLDADVSAHVGFTMRHPTSTAPITLRLLLSHRAALRDPADIGARRDAPLGDFVRRELDAGAFLDARPGAEERYSNLGAALAAHAVERASGESFAARAAHRVFEPLGMKDTSWTASSTAATAIPYAADGAGFRALEPASHAAYPANDLFTTARDLARFARAMLRGGELDGVRVLSAESVATMQRGSLGWQARTIGGRAVVGHEGEDAGASTGMFLDVAAGAGAFVMANGDAFASGDRARAAALEDLLAALLADAIASAR